MTRKPGTTVKIGKTELIALVRDETKISRKDATLLVNATINVIIRSLKDGKSVGLPGLGTFNVRQTVARTGVRPGSNEKIEIPAGRKITYKVAEDLKTAL